MARKQHNQVRDMQVLQAAVSDLFVYCKIGLVTKINAPEAA